MMELLGPALLLAAQVAGTEIAAPPPADPLTVKIQLADAERFAALFDKAGGAPGAEQLQAAYIAPGTYGVQVFTPGRIRNANHLAAAIAKDPQSYRRAIDTCLPEAKAAEPELRSVYLGLQGLLPEAKLPQIYMLFGAGNSGGTAWRGAQVLGLEVLCKVAPEPAAFRRLLRQFFAHETVHSLQENPGEAAYRSSPLLASALNEGGADFITMIVTGEVPEPTRARWAEGREAELWRQFTADMAAAKEFDPLKTAKDAPARAAYSRWIGNYNSAPEGWPHEAGYWVGMRIWQAYFERATDKRQAIRDVLTWKDPEAILRASGYAPGGAAAKK